MTAMSEFLPIIDHLRSAGSKSARGDLLLRMPKLVLGNYVEEISAILTELGDEPALNYVRAEYALLASVRDGLGYVQPEKQTTAERYALFASMEFGQ